MKTLILRVLIKELSETSERLHSTAKITFKLIHRLGIVGCMNHCPTELWWKKKTTQVFKHDFNDENTLYKIGFPLLYLNLRIVQKWPWKIIIRVWKKEYFYSLVNEAGLSTEKRIENINTRCETAWQHKFPSSRPRSRGVPSTSKIPAENLIRSGKNNAVWRCLRWFIRGDFFFSVKNYQWVVNFLRIWACMYLAG